MEERDTSISSLEGDNARLDIELLRLQKEVEHLSRSGSEAKSALGTQLAQSQKEAEGLRLEVNHMGTTIAGLRDGKQP